MCSHMDNSASEMADNVRLRTRTHDRRRRRPICLTDDAVRSARLRRLLDRSVEAGLAPPSSYLGRRYCPTLPLFHADRGGAELACARQVAMYLAHVAGGLTFTQAARLYGRNRTTAAHACRQVEQRRDDPMFDRILDLLERCVRAGLTQIEPQHAHQLRSR